MKDKINSLKRQINIYNKKFGTLNLIQELKRIDEIIIDNNTINSYVEIEKMKRELFSKVWS